MLYLTLFCHFIWVKNRSSLQEINLPLETNIEKSILFSILFQVENRKFIKRNNKFKIDSIFNFVCKIQNLKLIARTQNKGWRNRGRLCCSFAYPYWATSHQVRQPAWGVSDFSSTATSRSFTTFENVLCLFVS